MKTAIGITAAKREGVANGLAKILADEYVLYTKTKNAHWNIEGPDFYDKHKFFEMQFGELDVIVDSVAERIRTLGHYVDAMLKAFISVTQFTEQKSEKNDSTGYIKELLNDHETLIMSLRGSIHLFANEYDDLGSSDFITGLVETHEKMAWFLRSHLK
ncbi:DNA starvation/stationary phase protection protein [Flavobacterium sp.]|uniref:Dps family protein n=1 Tax=Flavobacterium sp. TaxID=239 RepID=UPI00261B590F|nr:DNA starvation/stationary phase protection protein [Flavobacterium sp.]